MMFGMVVNKFMNSDMYAILVCLHYVVLYYVGYALNVLSFSVSTRFIHTRTGSTSVFDPFGGIRARKLRNFKNRPNFATYCRHSSEMRDEAGRDVASVVWMLRRFPKPEKLHHGKICKENSW